MSHGSDHAGVTTEVEVMALGRMRKYGDVKAEGVENQEDQGFGHTQQHRGCRSDGWALDRCWGCGSARAWNWTGKPQISTSFAQH